MLAEAVLRLEAAPVWPEANPEAVPEAIRRLPQLCRPRRDSSGSSASSRGSVTGPADPGHAGRPGASTSRSAGTSSGQAAAPIAALTVLGFYLVRTLVFAKTAGVLTAANYALP